MPDQPGKVILAYLEILSAVLCFDSTYLSPKKKHVET